MAPMRGSRTTTLSLGLLAVLVNVGLVVAAVFLLGDGSDPGSGGSTATVTSTPPATTGPSGTRVPTDVHQLVSADRPIVIGILGDGTGDEQGEWVTVLGELLGTSRAVSLHNLDLSDPTRYAEQLTYGSVGLDATIWNGSRRGATADYAAERLDFLIPEEPDVVILNYGRDDSADEIGTRLDTTRAAIAEKWPGVPVLVTLQAQDRDDAIEPVRTATHEWAAANDVATIDVAGTFAATEDPNNFVSIVDPPSVNARGGRLWGETVFLALGGAPEQAASLPEEPSPTTEIETPTG